MADLSGSSSSGASGRTSAAAPRFRAGRVPLVLPLAALLWLGLFEQIGSNTWDYGKQTFIALIAVVVLLLLLPRAFRWVATGVPAWSIHLVALLALAGLSWRMLDSLSTALEMEGGGQVIDIAEVTYAAGTLFWQGKNPYAGPIDAARRATGIPLGQAPEGISLYGARYNFGFPYYPVMFLSYLPFRPLAEGFHSLRVANVIFLALDLIGIFWLSVCLSGRARPTAGWSARFAPGAVGGVLLLGIRALPGELIMLSVTDLVISVYALFAYVALTHARPRTAGILFGLAQACKLLPGPLLFVPAALWMYGKPGFKRLLTAYCVTSLAFVLPMFLRNPELFTSSTLLFYFAYHGEGDTSSLWYYLPRSVRPWFTLAGICASSGLVVGALRHRSERGVGWPLVLSCVAYLVFVAFSKMIHLNYLWSIYPLACVALVARASYPPRPAGAG